MLMRRDGTRSDTDFGGVDWEIDGRIRIYDA